MSNVPENQLEEIYDFIHAITTNFKRDKTEDRSCAICGQAGYDFDEYVSFLCNMNNFMKNIFVLVLFFTVCTVPQKILLHHCQINLT